MKTLNDLKLAYKKAVKDKEETFTIEGMSFVTGFAKYLIEYLEMIGIPADKPLNAIIGKEEPQ